MDSNYTLPDLENTKNREENTSNYGIENLVQDDEKDLEKTSPKLYTIINKLRDVKYGISFETITKIDLTSSGLDVEKAMILSRYLVNSPVEVLDLMYNNISDAGTEALVNAFLSEKNLSTSKRASNIVTLGLGCNGITDTGAQHLANLLRKSKSIKQLFLFQNNIGDVGISYICEALSSSPITNSSSSLNSGNSSLVLIGLGANEIGDKGAESIASMLLKNTSLQNLLLRQNWISRKGLISICNSLKENNSLCNLDVRLQKTVDRNQEQELIIAFEEIINKYNYRLSDLKISSDDTFISPCILRNKNLLSSPILEAILKNDLVGLSSQLSRDPTMAINPIHHVYPIFLASYTGYLKIFHLLVKYGANSNVSSDLGISCSEISHGEVRHLFSDQSPISKTTEVKLSEKWDFGTSSKLSSPSESTVNSSYASSVSLPGDKEEVADMQALVKKFEEKGINKERSKEYSNLLLNNGIDSSIYDQVSNDVLEQIGIKLVGDRLKILKALHDLSTGSNSSITSSDSASSTNKLTSSKEQSDESNYLTDIKILGKIGGGNFGSVFKGIWHNFTFVALKKSNRDSIYQFKEEASILMQLKHPNIVQYLGLWKSELGDEFIVTEYMALGSLCDMLREHDPLEMETFCLKEKTNKPGFFTLITLLKMCRDAAAGMTYLSKLNIIHRDLACRNLLVKKSDEDEYVVKISDFGLSKTHVEDYYVSNSTEFAWRTAAPEVIQYRYIYSKMISNVRKFSSASDVYSFATTVWEIFEFGKVPFGNIVSKDILSIVQYSDTPHSKPNCCPEELYSLLKKCWNPDRSKRPNFSEIAEKIVNLIEERTDYSNLFQEEETISVDTSNGEKLVQSLYTNTDSVQFKNPNAKQTEYDFTEV